MQVGGNLLANLLELSQALLACAVNLPAVRRVVAFEGDNSSGQHQSGQRQEPPAKINGRQHAKGRAGRLRAARAAGGYSPHLEFVSARREVGKHHGAQAAGRAPIIARPNQPIFVGQRLPHGKADSEEVNLQL